MAAPLTDASRWRRRAAALGVSLAVLLGHAWLAHWMVENRLGWGEGDRPPVRLEVAFVRALQPAAPPPPPAPAKPPARARPAARAADRPASAASVPTPPAAVTQAEAAEVPPALAEAALAALPVARAASTPATAAYDWLPPSTQLRYTLTGDVNGPVHGSAEVRWIRVGERYQVQIDTRVALVATRRLTSDGLLGPGGLRPRRYDEETEFVLTTPRRVTLRFEDDRIVGADGRSLPRPEGVQDTASQLVQLVWLFTTAPERLRAGERLALPLALARRVDLWSYEVLPAETVHTDFGAVAAFPVRPVRPPRADNVLTVQPWIAPSLQNLPVKLRIEQSERVYVELLLAHAPMQAAPAR